MCVCVFMCVSYTGIGIFSAGNPSASSGSGRGEPLENDKVVTRQVSAFINTTAISVHVASYGKDLATLGPSIHLHMG